MQENKNQIKIRKKTKRVRQKSNILENLREDSGLLEKLDKSRPTDLPVPELTFNTFLNQHKGKKIKDIVKTKEWQDIYSYYYLFSEDELDITIGETIEDFEKYSDEKQFEEMIKCKNNFFYFATKYLKVIHPTQGLLPFICFKYQVKIIDNYNKERFNMLSKFRQGGLTTLTVLWSFWRCTFQRAQKILVVSKTDREAVKAADHIRICIEKMPEWLRPNFSFGGKNKHEKVFSDTDSILSFHTIEAARSTSCSLFIIDEAAFIDKMDEHWASIYPTISTGGSCILISTVNGQKGRGAWYYEMHEKARSKENAFNIIEIDYWEHPEYNNPKWEADAKANLGDQRWLQEVLRYFLGTQDNYFPVKVIESLDRKTKSIQPINICFEQFANKIKYEFEGEGALWFWENRRKGRDYIIGVDCAEGMGGKSDNNCFQVLDTKYLKQVAEFYSNTITTHQFAKILFEIGMLFNIALIGIDTNGGYGTALVNELENRYYYENLYCDDDLNKKVGIKTSVANRQLIINSLTSKIYDDKIIINSPRFVDEVKSFISNNGKPMAAKGAHDDAIMAMATATYIYDKISYNSLQSVSEEQNSNQNNSFDEEMFAEIRREISSDTAYFEDEKNVDSIQDYFFPNRHVQDYLYKLELKKRDKNNILREFGL